MLWHHDAKGVKKVLCGQLDGKGWEQLIDETPEHRCIHDKEIVCGRWGCQDHYAALRKTELAEVDKESRPKALRESLLINKRAWEKLPLGAKWDRNMDKEWPGVKEEAKYQVNWMRNLEFEFPTDKQISSANSCPVPCLKHKDTDVDDRCESHDWQDMRVDICMKKFDMIDKMIGGYVGASLGWHSFFTYDELILEFDHAFPVPYYQHKSSLKDKVKAMFKPSTE